MIRHIAQCILFLHLLSSVALAAGDHPAASPEFEAYEGNFYFFSDTPNTLYLMGDIGKDVSSRAGIAFRRAIRNHDIDKLVLMSGGGRVDIGLEYAAIIRDKDIAVYVPKDSYCYSACSYMFFGGVGRYAAGEVGVHQFYADTDRQDKISRVQQAAQYGVSDIIAILNSFNVPPTLYEHMFSTASADMYILNSEEMTELGQESKQAWHEEVDTFLADLAKTAALVKSVDDEAQQTDTPTVAPRKPSIDQQRRQTIARIQTLLNEHNCGAGYPDGIAGTKTNQATFKFIEATGLPIDVQQDNALAILLAALNETPRPACLVNPPKRIDQPNQVRSPMRVSAGIEGNWSTTMICGTKWSGQTLRGVLTISEPKLTAEGRDYQAILKLDNRDQFNGRVSHTIDGYIEKITVNLTGTRQNRGYEGRIFVTPALIANTGLTITADSTSVRFGPSKGNCNFSASRR